MKSLPLTIAAVLLTLLGGCGRQDSLAEIRERGELVVASRNSPTTYYQDKNGPTGFEYALCELLAEELGVELRMETVYSLRDLFTRLDRQTVNIAAAGLTLTEERAATYPHSTSYYKLTPQVIYVTGNDRPRELADLSGRKIVVLAGSSHVQMLKTLQQSEIPDLQWEEIDEADTTQLLEQLRGDQAALAIIDSNEFAVQQSLYPRQQVAFDLGREQDMVWYLPPGIDNTRLLAFIDDFLLGLQQDGTLESLRNRYFGHTDGVSRMNAFEFAQNIEGILPAYEPLIRKIANEYQMDWHLLAAMAYQESHWDPMATSPTGVRGMMMLTRATARELGVDNRLDVVQSLRGGARYLKNIKRRLPKKVQEPDRTWLALAAYNIGLAHLEDARRLTERQGGNPNLWQDVMQRLPLLQKTQYYKHTRYGYARGREAVTLVQNIRHYYSVLAWQEIPEIQPLPPVRGDDHLPAAVRGLQLQAL
ncbi:MAG: membrane-bound lytic murein transglycosylase MltF [Halioglobus sp.]|nr:membrane-bound lytic murein transglycosylase MltF [Halioglobus sp.]